MGTRWVVPQRRFADAVRYVLESLEIKVCREIRG